MEKEFIPCTEALALKELGFDEPCLGYYNYEGCLKFGLNVFDEVLLITNKGKYKKACLAPTYQSAFRWFRDVKGIYTSGADSVNNDGTRSYFYDHIYDIEDNILFSCYDEFASYEEAELACLRKLIEIVKQ